MLPPADPASAAALAIDMPPSSALLAATIAAAASASAPTSTSSSALFSATDDDQGDCELLGPFALLVQLALGGLALLALVYKRWRERPQRPVKIWFFDVSKQVFGSVLVHAANVFMSMLTSGSFSINEMEPVTTRLMKRGTETDDGYVPNPCSWYLLNLAIDVSWFSRPLSYYARGIPILIILLRIFTGLVSFTPLGNPPESIQSGNYGNPPNKWWWLKQSIIYFLGLFGMKICVLILFLLMPWISRIGDWALGWTEGNEKLQIAFVMMIFPLIMNAMQYYIIDSFIKLNEKGSDQQHERLPSEDPDERGDRGASQDLEGVLGDSDDDSDGDEVKRIQAKRQPLKPGEEEYDPEVDGEARTEVGSGSSSRPGTRQKTSLTLDPVPDLYPKE
ncbi:STIMATE family protein [Sarocladium implicatum]|nr:STIMATE family protein [Sarocladium implicatum]